MRRTYNSLLLLIILSFLTLKVESTLKPIKHICSDYTYPNTTSYNSNLKLVLDSLSANSRSRSGYYNTSSITLSDTLNNNNTVYGSFLCRGDIGPEECEECVVNVTKTILSACSESQWAIQWYDQCTVRYSDRYFFSSLEIEPQIFMRNADEVAEPEIFAAVLNRTVGKMMYDLLGDDKKYLRLEKKYKTEEAKVMDKENVYVMAQCEPNLNVSGCRTCLDIAGSLVQTVNEGKIGGRVLFPSCFVRFEIYHFYAEYGENRKSKTMIVVHIVVILVVFVAACVLGYFLMRWKCSKRKNDFEDDPIELLCALQFSLHVIEEATNNFSSDNELGEGGFGHVYKGTFPSGQEFAAKRMALGSGQGAEEFKNEVQLVAKLQHKNLVRMFGFCLEREETILLYEYVPNGSLDHYLFDPDIRWTLDWETRNKIILGIARGLMYLHEDSRLRVVHRDLKASNILLDADMNPKISDFGMARIFGADQQEDNTKRIVGTYGYMSPEYMMFGHFSTKSDVFSFGVLVLEIITGKKNSSFLLRGLDGGLLGFVWKHWSEGAPSNLADPALGKSYSVNEFIRCVHIGLLCVQDDAKERPTIDSVILMLNSNSISLPLPLRPTFFFPGRKNKQAFPSTCRTPSEEKPTFSSVGEEGPTNVSAGALTAPR